MSFKLGKESRGVKNSQSTPIFRKNLPDGVLGMANKNGTIDVDKSLKPGSEKEKSVINHETKHVEDMKSGKLSYGDDYIRHNGKTYPRKDGKIKYNGKWSKEGSHSFPWEKDAMKAE